MSTNGSMALTADDDEFFRLALRVVLTEKLHIPEVLETGSLDDAIEAMSINEAVRFAFFDLNMEGLDTFSGIRATREAFPYVRVAVVSASRDRWDVLRALDAGAHGFVPKGDGVKQMEEAINLIVNGGIYVPEFIADIQGVENGAPGQSFEGTTPEERHLENLTPRQNDVLTHVIKGMSNKEIARAMSVSESTVKFHVASLCLRLGVKNRTQIAAQASRFRPR
ncbi:response regulator transcription factor [Rhodobacteraceae bacterium 2376]|uniref:Response regulator transcription factor n=1 Tax=Rhabdonatronobacter sediminivivens TaxID=2743469 RepID=A0A7Z0I2G5_9RHOB|nr:response regulator transcription factor [Rhabdonatronobacter sediminivivens]NYS26730.1 response regulator transcription factor [Rhabdonatronobacter sediminivivens]